MLNIIKCLSKDVRYLIHMIKYTNLSNVRHGIPEFIELKIIVADRIWVRATRILSIPIRYILLNL